VNLKQVNETKLVLRSRVCWCQTGRKQPWLPTLQSVPHSFHFHIRLQQQHWQINLLSTICWRIYGQPALNTSTWDTWWLVNLYSLCSYIITYLKHRLFANSFNLSDAHSFDKYTIQPRTHIYHQV